MIRRSGKSVYAKLNTAKFESKDSIDANKNKLENNRDKSGSLKHDVALNGVMNSLQTFEKSNEFYHKLSDSLHTPHLFLKKSPSLRMMVENENKDLNCEMFYKIDKTETLIDLK